MLFLGYQSSGKNYSTLNNQSERVKAEEQKLRQCERDLEQIFGALLSGEVDSSTLSSSDQQQLQYVECSFSLHGSDLSKSAKQQDKLFQSTYTSGRKPTALSKLRRSLVRQKASTQSHTNQPINAISQDADNSVLQNGQSSLLKLESQQQQQQEYIQKKKIQTHAADVSVVESHVTLSQSIERLSTIAGDFNVDTAEEFSMQSDITVLDTRDNVQFQHDKKSVEHGSIQQEVVSIAIQSDYNAAITLDQDNPSIAAIDLESKVVDAVSSDINLVKEDIPSAQVSSQNELESNNHENLQILTEERTDVSGQQMVFDLKTQRWIGNEDELDIFDQMEEEDDRVVDIMDNDTLVQSTHQNDTTSAKQETRKLSEVLLKDIQLGSLEDLEIDDVEQDNHDNNTSKPVVLKIGLGNELDDLDIITDSSDNLNDIDNDDDMAFTRQSMHLDSNSQQQQQQQSRTARDSDTQTLRSIKSLAPSIQSNSLEPDLSYFEVPARLEEWETQHNEWVQSLKGENFSFEDAFEASISQTRKPN
ncbi:hypothetical protein MP228_004706 [Amoeboaphelidium protococcarum]|nr:hypothetical protein MP228_004706 [Amoeboaphelidium protococcarum]